ncbi:MAG: glycosyltransferase family 2 protein [Candidatus Cybelea sp.]
MISVVICTLNEEAYIGPVLDDIVAQEGVDGRVEILLVDGGSTDRTREIAASYGAVADIRIIDNPRRHQVFGYNLAIAQARGAIFCILHGHARYSKSYLANCLEVKRRTGAASVGGVVRHEGDGVVGQAIALAMSSPLGVGDSKYRHSKREEFCDSVMGTFMDVELFDEIGTFNESNIVNQDGEFNYRLRAAGHRLVVSPSIECTYYVRPSLKKLAVQYYRYGFYRRWTEVQHPGSVPWRVYAPPALVGGLTLSAALALAGRRAASLVVPVLYATVMAAACLDGIKRSRRLSVGLLEPAAIATMHLCFGAGWLRGFVAHSRPRPRY